MERPQRRTSQEYSPDYRRYFHLIYKNWYWFLLSLGLALIVSKFINTITPRIYMVSCDVVVGDDQNVPAPAMSINGGIDFNQLNPINKEIGILKSKNLAEQTIHRLDFEVTYYELIRNFLIKRRRYDKIPFVVQADSEGYNRKNYDLLIRLISPDELFLKINGDYDISRTIHFNEEFHNEGFAFRILRNEDYPISGNMIGNEYLILFNNLNTLADEFSQNLNIQVNTTSQNILTLSLTGENVFQSIDYLHKFCELYIQNDIELRNRIANNTLNYIDNQLEILNRQLVKAEDSLINFKRQHRIFQDAPTVSFSDEFLKLESDLKSLILYRQSVESLRNSLDSIITGKNYILPSVFVGRDSRLSNGLEKINELVLSREYLLKNQKAGSPEVLKISQQLQVEIKAFTFYLAEELQFVSAQILSRSSEQKKRENSLLELPAVERQLAKLQRDFELTENLYNLYQQKRIEANLAKASTVSKIRVLDPATADRAVLISPKKGQNLQIAIILSLILPAVLIILTDILSNKITDSRELSHHFASPVIGKLLHSNSDLEIPAIQNLWSGFTESLRTLYARLDKISSGNDYKVITLTSGGSGEGKTFIAVNLAAVMAATGKKVLIIGIDLRRPKLHEIFDIGTKAGLSSYLAGHSEKSEIIFSTSIPNLSIMPSGPIPPNPVELLSKEIMERLVKELRMEFDYILFDTAPVGLVADPLILNKFTDVNLFLVRLGYTGKSIISFLRDIEENGTLKNLCLVANDVTQSEKYGNGYYSNYYQNNERSRVFKLFRKKIFG